MAEPASSAIVIAATATGLTVFGVATGLNPSLLIAGLAGGLWALSYMPPMPAWKRATTASLSSLLAGWSTPAIVVALTSLEVWPKTVTPDLVQFPVAVAFGLLAHTVIGPAMLRLATRKIEEYTK